MPISSPCLTYHLNCSRRNSSLQSLSDSALYQRRVSTFSHDVRQNSQRQHQPANTVISEKQQNTDDEQSEKAADIETAVSLTDGQQNPGSEREESTESSLVDVEMERASDMRESEDEEQLTVEDDVQVIDLQQESDETDKSRNEGETNGGDVTKAEEEKEMQGSKKDGDLVEGDENKKRIEEEEEGDIQDNKAVEQENPKVPPGDSVGGQVVTVDDGETPNKDEQEQHKDSMNDDKVSKLLQFVMMH